MLSATTYDSGQFGKSFRAPCITRRFREAIIAVTCRRGVLHGIARHDDFEHSRSRHRQGTRRRSTQHEGRNVKLTLSLAMFIPISGWMADRFGTRRVFSFAIGLFTLGSFFCDISSNLHVLVACRIFQGCGGAMMVPVRRLTLMRTFPKSELIRAMSFVAIPGLIGPMRLDPSLAVS